MKNIIYFGLFRCHKYSPLHKGEVAIFIEWEFLMNSLRWYVNRATGLATRSHRFTVEKQHVTAM